MKRGLSMGACSIGMGEDQCVWCVLGLSVVSSLERRRPQRTGRRPRQDQTDSCVVSSDDEDLSRDKDVYVTMQTPRSTRDDTVAGLRYWRLLLRSFSLSSGLWGGLAPEHH